jgi:hypothetical protein
MLSLGKNTAFWQHSDDLGVPVLMQTISKNTVSAARAFGLLFSADRAVRRGIHRSQALAVDFDLGFARLIDA